MPCLKCGGPLVVDIEGKEDCPKCSGIALLPRHETITFLEENLQLLEKTMSSMLRNRLEKNKILGQLLWLREEFSRDFFTKYQAFDLNGFLSLNLLVYRITKEPYFNAKKDSIDYLSEAKELNKVFKDIIQMRANFLLFKEGLAEATKHNNKIKILPNEQYFSINNTYEDNDVLVKPKADEKIKEYTLIYDEIVRNQQHGQIDFSPQEFIENFYSLINQFYCCLLRNEVYSEVFDLLERYNEIDLSPRQLMDFVNSYPIHEDSLHHTSVSEFIRNAKKHFELPEKKIRDALLFYEGSSNNFPLFSLVNGRVYISHRTSFLLYILLHAICYRDLFNRETEKRSRQFEKDEVKKYFESIGWLYYPNKTDKKQQSLEIDGIATFDKKMLVIECKGWQLYRFYETQKRQGYLTRDIKGIVDGEKFSGEKATKIPGLLDKIAFVKKNMNIWGFKASDYDEVKGTIIMKSYPSIPEYKGVQVLSIREIPDKFDERKTK